MNMLSRCVRWPVAMLLFVVVMGAAMLREACGQLRHGRNWEPGDGIGREEDYSS